MGLYTSPHLCDIRERIQINGDMIPHADFARLIRSVAPHVNRMEPSPSFFDVITAIAFKYFAEQDVDIAVIETGLGGRLDSTNVIKPEVTAQLRVLAGGERLLICKRDKTLAITRYASIRRRSRIHFSRR